MKLIDKLVKLAASQGITIGSSQGSSGRTTTQNVVTQADTSFVGTLDDLLGAHTADDEVSEEDLFASGIGLQIRNQIGEAAYDNYKTIFQIAMTEPATGHSAPSSEFSARQAVKYLVLTGDLTRDQSRSIRRFARDNAQLDENNALFDHVGDTLDNSKAVEYYNNVEVVVGRKFTASAVTPTTTTPTTPATTNPVPTTPSTSGAPSTAASKLASNASSESSITNQAVSRAALTTNPLDNFWMELLK